MQSFDTAWPVSDGLTSTVSMRGQTSVCSAISRASSTSIPGKGDRFIFQLYSLVETAKANGQEPYAYLRHILERLPQVNSVEGYEALLPWNCTPAIAP